MKQEYNRLFDKITSDRSDDQLLEGVLRKANNMEKKAKLNKKAILIPVAAALTLSIGRVAVGAANDWDYAGILSSFFAGRAAENNSVLQSDFDFNKYGMAINKTITREDCSITVHSITADRNTAYILADITVNELAEGNLDLKDVYLLGYLNDTECFSSASACIAQNGNTFTMNCPISIDGNKEFPNSEVTFTLQAFSYFTTDENGEYTTNSIDLYEEIEVDMSDFRHDAAYRTITVDAPYEHIGSNNSIVNVTLNEIHISPLSFSYNIVADIEDEQEIYENHSLIDGALITFADGSTMDFNNASMVYKDGHFNCNHITSYPIDPDDVVSVTITGITYDLSEID